LGTAQAVDRMSEEDRVGSVLLDRYRIEGMLGRGGMSTVYRGMQLSVQRPVAIKLIAGSIAREPECVQRFRREAEAMARLQHPSSVRIYEFGVTEAQELFIVMELLEGQDLAELVHARGALPLAEALGIVHQVLEALCEAHTLGVVHRDLKPANIFLAQLPRSQVLVKVMDFGIAGIEQATEDTKLTQSGVVMGTPTYLSPEQALGKPADARSDLYSLGVTLFEMLVGKPPFAADATAALLVAHVSNAPPRLAQVRPDRSYSPALQSFVDSLLAKRPEDRPGSAELALSQLEELAEREQLVLGVYSRLRASSAHLLAATPRSLPPDWAAFVQGVQRTLPSLVQGARQQRTGIVLGALILLLGAAWLLIGTTGQAPEPVHTVRPAAIALAAAGAAASGLNQARIVTSPSGASVQLNGVELGRTPYVLQFRGPTQLVLSLPGYDPQALMVTPDSEPNLALELSPLVAAETRAGVRGPVVELASAQSMPAEAAPEATLPHGAQEPIQALPAEQAVPRPRAEYAADSASPPIAASARAEPSDAALLAPAGRPRREALIELGSPYPNVLAARRARESGGLDASSYRDVIWALRTLRNRRIDAQKQSYRKGLITRAEYERREHQIELDYAGK
jgi:hypothetical protein